MLIRMKATGQVEDFAPGFAQAALASGLAELTEQKAKPATTTPPTILGVPTIEAATIVPPTSTATFQFQRGPRGSRFEGR